MLQHSDVVGLTIRQYMQEQQEIAKRTITEFVFYMLELI